MKSLAERWLPLQDREAWRLLKEKFPETAQSMFGRARIEVEKVFGDELREV